MSTDVYRDGLASHDTTGPVHVDSNDEKHIRHQPLWSMIVCICKTIDDKQALVRSKLARHLAPAYASEACGSTDERKKVVGERHEASVRWLTRGRPVIVQQSCADRAGDLRDEVSNEISGVCSTNDK